MKNREISVPSALVNTIEHLSEFVRTHPAVEEIKISDHVVVTRGKHCGKEGKVCILLGQHVEFIEDSSEVQVSFFRLQFTLIGLMRLDINQIKVHRSSVRLTQKPSYPYLHPNRPNTPPRPPTPIKTEEIVGGSNDKDGAIDLDTFVKLEDVPVIFGPENVNTDGKFEAYPINVDTFDPEKEKCAIDHFTEGFEDKIVYVWEGPRKSKFVRVKEMSGGVVKIEIQSAIQGSNLVDELAQNLVVYARDPFNFYFSSANLLSVLADAHLIVRDYGQKIGVSTFRNSSKEMQ